MEQINLQDMSFTDLMDIYTTRCEELGQAPDDTFKTKEVLVDAINRLAGGPTGNGEDTSEGPHSEKQQKYNSSGKRGPNQGIGAFAKEQIALGKSNDEILSMINSQFPTARTSASCIAYYRNAVKKGGSVGSTKGTAQDPAALRQKAKELLNLADKVEKEQAEAAVKGDLEVKIREEVEARIRAEVEAKYQEMLAAQAAQEAQAQSTQQQA